MSPSYRRSAQLLVALCLLSFVLVAPWAPADDKKAASSAATPAPRKEALWKKRHEGFLAIARKGHVDVLFLGDSITQGWDGNGKDIWKERYEPLHAVNFGIGGDRTQHVLWRLQEGKELEGIQPRCS